MRIFLVRPGDVSPGVWYGVSRYATSMVQAMHRIDSSVEFVALHGSLRGRVPQDRSEVLARAGVRLLPVRFPDLSALRAYHPVLDRLIAPRFADQAGCDLAWGTNCETLRKGRRRYRTAMTIHDLFLITHPELSENRFTHLVGPKLRAGAQEADVILTDSKFTAGQIVQLLGVDERKITVTYAGCNLPQVETVDDDPREILDELEIAEPPILSVGTVEPRKNYERGLRAYQLLQRYLGTPPPWVIVGRDGWKFERFYAERSRRGLETRVRVLKHVDDTQLARLYRAARCLFCPSLIEGFGLPVLEAMTAGLPVVSSTGGSLPEVTGDAAFCVEPQDNEAMADALGRVLTDAKLADDFVARGRVQANCFTWERAARKALDAFRRVIG